MRSALVLAAAAACAAAASAALLAGVSREALPVDGGGICGSAAQCFWNGACVAQVCECSGAWTGPNCNLLAEQDSVQVWPDPAQPLPPDDLVTDSWGATIARDPGTGLFWLYVCVACVFDNGAPQPFSMHNSGIVAAHAPALEGPYTLAGGFEGVFSEGPHMVRGPGGAAAFLLITPSANSSTLKPVVCTGAGTAAASSGAPLLSPPAWRTTVNKTSLWSAPSPAGPWAQHNFAVAELGNLGYFSNPSLALDVNGTGTTYLAFRVNLVEPEGRGETLALAIAPAWDAPVYRAIAEPLLPGLVGYEDPFLWVHTEEGEEGPVAILSVLEHTQFNGSAVGGLFVSDDGGVTWVQSPLPAYTLDVSMTGPGWAAGNASTAVPFLRRERPELLFDPTTGAPTHLLTGAMLGGRGPTKSWQLSYSIATRVGKGARAQG